MVPGSGTMSVDLKPGAPKAEAAPLLKLTVEPAPMSRCGGSGGYSVKDGVWRLGRGG